MSTIQLISKEAAGGAGNFLYVYSCTCGGGTSAKNIEITSANDTQADALALMECNENCGEGFKYDLSAKVLGDNTIFVETPEKRTSPLSTAYPVEWPVSGSGSGPKPDVYARNTKNKIERIVGISSDIPGITKVTGVGTDVLTIEIWPSGLRYDGTVRFTLVL